MAILKMATAKTRDFSLVDGYISDNNRYNYVREISSTKYRSSRVGQVGYSYKLQTIASSNNVMIFNTPSLPTTVYCRVAVYIDTTPGPSYNNNMSLFSFCKLTVEFCSFYINTDTAVCTAISPDTTFGTTSITLNAWNVIEMYLYLHATAGRVVVRINGIDTAINYTGKTIYNVVNSEAQYFIVKPASNSATDPVLAPIYYVDDIMIRDDTWCGTGVIELCNVNGNVAGEQDWTPSAGNAFDCVSDVPADWSDYISTPTATPGNLSLFTVNPLIYEPTAITAVGVIAYAKTDLPGPAAAKIALKSGSAAVQYGALKGLVTDPQKIQSFHTTNPDGGGAWNRAAVEALKIGIENG